MRFSFLLIRCCHDPADKAGFFLELASRQRLARLPGFLDVVAPQHPPLMERDRWRREWLGCR